MPEPSEPVDRKTRLRKLADVPRFSIESAHVDPERLLVERGGNAFKLDLRQMELLVALASAPAKDWSKDELLKKAWRSIEFSDSMLHKNISILRDALGDDPKSPTCIQSLPKKGYRLIGQVRGIDNRLVNPLDAPNWAGLNPYVGLAAFDSRHEDVFFGRDDLIKRVHAAIRSQRRNGRGFVLIVGSSGCGKTSLLQAGVLPPMMRDDGVDGLQALTLARCDFGAAQPGELLHHLAAALCTWQLDRRSVFHEPSAAILAETLAERPDSLGAAIDDAWSKRPAPLREKAKDDAHLLLVIDHAEALVGKPKDDAVDTTGEADLARERAQVEALVDALCSHPRVLVVAVVRGDYYAQLADAMPVLMARKGGEGHVDVPLPQPAEITQMIRGPAAIARLAFDQRPEDGARLDDVLRDATIGQPDALPLLQHTLAALCEARDEQDTLTFAAYDALGGLEGALARRAEEVFRRLPDHVQRQLDAVLSLLIQLDGDTERVRGRSVLWTLLPDDPTRALVNAFINARLFVSGGSESRLDFRVAHEALLRRWPRAREWTQDNGKLLLARARLERAADRWVESGRRDDLLLNPGQPLGEAFEVARRLPARVDAPAREFLAASARARRNKRRWRRGAIAALMLSTLISAGMAYSAWSARGEADARNRMSQRLIDYMLVDLAEPLRLQGDLKLLDGIAAEALAHLQGRDIAELSVPELIHLSKAFRTTGEVLSQRGKPTEAASAFRDATIVIDRARTLAPESAQTVFEAAQIAFFSGDTDHRRRLYPSAEAHFVHYAQLGARLAKLEPQTTRGLVETSYALNSLGTLARDRGDSTRAVGYFERSLSLKRHASRIAPDDLSLQYDINDTESWINSIRESDGRLRAAAEGYARNIDTLRELLRKKTNADSWRHQLARYQQLDAMLALKMGRLERADASIRDATTLLESLTKDQPDNHDWQGSLGYSWLIAGDIHIAQGRKDAALASLLRADAEARRQLASTDAENPRWRRIQTRIRWQNAYLNQNRLAMDSAVNTLEDLYAKHPDDGQLLHELGEALLARAEWRMGSGEIADAAADCARIDALLVGHSGSRDARLIAQWVRAHRVMQALGRPDKHAVDEPHSWLCAIGYGIGGCRD